MVVVETFEVRDEGAAAFGELATRGFKPVARVGIPTMRDPDDRWVLAGGKGVAWVYRVPGKKTLTKPVIMADGFSAGESMLGEWASLFEGSEVADAHHWGTRLHEQGRDIIILGYKSRSAAILDNAEVAIECILKAISERDGSEPLVVGGLSMGGLVTRYALAKMESQAIDHEVKTYFSYDSPHQGAWIPISLQVFAHFLALLSNMVQIPPGTEEQREQMRALSILMNSAASRELLWKHTEAISAGPFGPAPERQIFLDELRRVGDWPQRPHLLGVANGRGDGQGLDVKAGEPNLVWPPQPDVPLPGATLYSQDAGEDQLVAELYLAGDPTPVTTSEIPALDGAPGGTLNSFEIAANALIANGFAAEAKYPHVCFVPVASAVDLGDPSEPDEPVNSMDPSASGLHEFKVASKNEGHTLITKELCDWLTERF